MGEMLNLKIETGKIKANTPLCAHPLSTVDQLPGSFSFFGYTPKRIFLQLNFSKGDNETSATIVDRN